MGSKCLKNRWIPMTVGWLAAFPLMAGVVYEIEVTDHEQSPPKSESIQVAVEGRNLKMGIASKGKGAQGEMIYRGDRREMVIVDHENRSYVVLDQAAINAIGKQLNQFSRQMEEALKNVPADQRAMIEKMMKQKMPDAAPQRPQSEFRNTNEEAEHNGYPCVKYEVWRDGRKIRDVWVTDWDNVEGGSEVVNAFEDMADFFGDLMDAIPDMGGRSNYDDHVFAQLKELGGFPVVTRDFDDDGSLEDESALRSSKRVTLDPDAFEPPSGYKRQEMFPGQ